MGTTLSKRIGGYIRIMMVFTGMKISQWKLQLAKKWLLRLFSVFILLIRNVLRKNF